MSGPLPVALDTAVGQHPYPLLFATVSGAHLYGFASADSDWDLRGAHLLPARELLGLHPLRETLEVDRVTDGLELDLVTHDAGKFFRMLLRRNGYVLEQLHSPLVVHTTPGHAELRDLARACVTVHHAYHYLGFSADQWKKCTSEPVPRVKPLLYTFRTLLTGIHLLRTGEVEANLERLNLQFQLPYLDDLIALKRGGTEKEPLRGDLTFYGQEYLRLTRELEMARDVSPLRRDVTPDATAALSDLLVRLRGVVIP